MTTTTAPHWSDTFGLPVAISGRGATKERRSIERQMAITGLKRYSERERGLVTPALTISATHASESKRYLFMVDRVLITPFGFRAVIDFRRTMPEDLKVLSYAVNAPRYSLKRMQELHAQHLAVVEPHLAALLDWARGADDGE